MSSSRSSDEASVKLKRPNVDRSDLLLLLGCAVVACGIWQIYPPAAWIFAGLVLAVLGVVSDLVPREPAALAEAPNPESE